NPDEVATLAAMCRPQLPAAVSSSMFADLHTSEAALLPGAEESKGVIRRFRFAPRLTEHVRHKTKYADMPVADAHAFVFSDGDHPWPRAYPLREFIDLLLHLPPERLAGHLQRHDLSRWIGDVFRDRPLALKVRALEARLPSDDVREVASAIAQAIRARYETAA